MQTKSPILQKIFRLTTRGRRHEPDDDLERLLAAVLDGDHDGGAAVAAAEVRVDVAVLQQVEDGAGHVEPARRVQRGQPELVQQVHLKVGNLPFNFKSRYLVSI